MEFIGKTAIVTGASSGIGLEFARELHFKGASVILIARRTDLLEGVASELNSRRQDSAKVLPLDLSTSDGVDSLVNYIKTNTVDILVNNAGFGSFGFFEIQQIERELEMINLNVLAVFRATHAVIPQLKERRWGVIITVSSVAGLQPLPYMSTYSATKAFECSLMVSLWHELREYGIKALSVNPGPVDTPFIGGPREPGTVTGWTRRKPGKVVKSSMNALTRGVPLVVPGIREWTLAAAVKFFPKSISTYLVGRLLRKLA